MIIFALMFGFAAFLLSQYLYDWNLARARSKNPADKYNDEIDSLLFKIFLPIIKKISPQFCRFKLDRYRSYISRALLEAGLDEMITQNEFLAFQSITVFVLFLLSIIFDGVLSKIIFVLGIAYPFFLLRSLRRQRMDNIVHVLPRVLDLLSLSVEAGLDLFSAMSRVVGKSKKSVITNEISRMLGGVKLGKSRFDALTELKRRLAHPSIDSLVGLLNCGDRLGTPIGPILKAQAEKLRSDRFQNAERAGAQAAEKLLIPLIFCIMPTVFIVIFGPILIMWRSGGLERLFS